MELRIKHNLPYVVILMLFGILSKIYVGAPITSLNTLISVFTYYFYLLFFQVFNRPLEQFTIGAALKKQAPLILLLSSGAILCHYFMFHSSFTLIALLVYPLLTTIILITMERSSYN